MHTEAQTSQGDIVLDPAARRPIVLDPNQPPRPYHGGAGIAALRGLAAVDDDVPEDFVGSTTTVWGSDSIGLTLLSDGRSLRDHIEADPVGFLGDRHTAAYGADPRVLVKLLDTAERLFVHFHPDARFAAEHLDCDRGKSEGWIVTAVADLPDESAGHVYLGFREDVSAEQVAAWVAGQQISSMLTALNKVPVRPGDTVFVPAGTPHAIGAGVTCVELQEPVDLSILLEWTGFDVAPEARHLGLGYPTALAGLDRTAWDRTRLAHARATRTGDLPGVTRVFPADADRFFRAEVLRVDGRIEFPAQYAILIVTAGAGTLSTATGDLPLTQGVCLLVPHGAGACHLTGALELVRCLPPEPAEDPMRLGIPG